MTGIEGCGEAAATWAVGEGPNIAVQRAIRRAARLAAKLGVLVGITALGLGVAASLVPGPAATTSRAAVADAPADGAWVDINRPFQLFALTGGDVLRLPQSYRARRHPEGGGRQDLIGFGDGTAEAPLLEIMFYRIGREAAATDAFAQSLDPVAAAAGTTVMRIAAPTPLVTRFGPFEVADLRMAGPDGRRSCLGFRSRPDGREVLRVSGVLCGPANQPLARDSLGCVLDRIDLVSAGDDDDLRQVFVDAERRRGPRCRPSPLTAAGARPTWLDANASLPTLRGSAGGVTRR